MKWVAFASSTTKSLRIAAKRKKNYFGFNEASKLTETTSQGKKDGCFSMLFRVKALFRRKVARKHICKQQTGPKRGKGKASSIIHVYLILRRAWQKKLLVDVFHIGPKLDMQTGNIGTIREAKIDAQQIERNSMKQSQSNVKKPVVFLGDSFLSWSC